MALYHAGDTVKLALYLLVTYSTASKHCSRLLTMSVSDAGPFTHPLSLLIFLHHNRCHLLTSPTRAYLYVNMYIFSKAIFKVEHYVSRLCV